MLRNLFSKNTQTDEGNGKVVSILNQKGGVGKTTMAFNMAHALYNEGKKVLVIDMDPQTNLSMLFDLNLNTPYNIFHLLVNSVRELKGLHSPAMAQDVIQNVQVGEEHDGVLDVIPSGQELSGFELTVAGISAPRQLVLKKFIEKNELKHQYDYILLDGPPTLGLVVVNILCATDGVLVPFQPDQFSRMGLEHFHDVIEDVGDMGIVAAPRVLGYIPNLMENRRKQSNEDFDTITGELAGRMVFDGFPNKAQLAKSSAMKKSVFHFNNKDYLPLQEQFKKMAEYIDNQWM